MFCSLFSTPSLSLALVPTTKLSGRIPAATAPFTVAVPVVPRTPFSILLQIPVAPARLWVFYDFEADFGVALGFSRRRRCEGVRFAARLQLVLGLRAACLVGIWRRRFLYRR